MKCPICSEENDYDWPLEINNDIVRGGCQDCWEQQLADSWWDMVKEFGCDE